jgi:hypothetical protein
MIASLGKNSPLKIIFVNMDPSLPLGISDKPSAFIRENPR